MQGMLVYNDNSLHDPWLVAQHIISHTRNIAPMVAVQPVYESPFSAARAINSIGHMYHRRIDLNMVTGGFSGHLKALGCALTHDERYDRLIEFGQVLMMLLRDSATVNYDGEHYRINSAYLTPPALQELTPRIFISGSSPASQRAQVALDAIRLSYPLWIEDYLGSDPLANAGMRIGIIARPQSDEAWRIARRRFPADAVGERLHDYAGRTAQSVWHKNLSFAAQRSLEPAPGYWLYPFRAYKTFCPYLVGSYGEVAALLRKYIKAGVEVIILDVPHSEGDLHHALTAIDLATAPAR